MPFEVEQFTPIAKNTLVGFATIRLPSGMVLHDCNVHKKGASVWVSPPGKPVLDRTGQHIRDNNGKAQWAPIITFGSRASKDRFTDGVIEALRLSNPGVLDD